MQHTPDHYYSVDLSPEELDLIRNYRRCSDAMRRNLLIYVAILKKEVAPPNNVIKFPSS